MKKVRFLWLKTVGPVMIFREEMVQNAFWHIFTRFGFFLFFTAHLSFCPVNRKACYFLVLIFLLFFYCLFF